MRNENKTVRKLTRNGHKIHKISPKGDGHYSGNDLSFMEKTRNAFCGTWYPPHSHVHNERTVPIITAKCIAHARNGRISTSGLKSDVTTVFLDPDFLSEAKISATGVQLRQI